MIIYKLPECRVIEKLPEGCALALGNFDGVHKGHQKLFELAGKKGHKKTVWTFTTLAKPGLTVPYLTDMKTKIALFKQYGIDYAVFEDFEDIRNIEYTDFAKKYLVDKFSPARVVCGFNFRFGHGGKGNAAKLQRLLSEINIDVDVLQPVLCHSKTVSSSSVRDAIILGDMEEAAELLGHPFSVSFPVVSGKKLGRKMGFPTINQNFPEGHIIPRYGVYACTATVDEKVYIAVTNVGIRPTVSDADAAVNCETHILDYSGDLYGKEIKIDFFKMIREEITFSSIEALTAQLKKDIECAKAFFARPHNS